MRDERRNVYTYMMTCSSYNARDTRAGKNNNYYYYYYDDDDDDTHLAAARAAAQPATPDPRTNNRSCGGRSRWFHVEGLADDDDAVPTHRAPMGPGPASHTARARHLTSPT